MKPSIVKQSLFVSLLAGVLTLFSSTPSHAQIFCFTDYSSGGTVFAVNSSGLHTAYATGLNSPTGLAVDASGDLFVSNATNGTIDEITPHAYGTSTTSFTQIASGLNHPYGMAFDASGNLYVMDQGSGTITRIINLGSTPVLNTYVSGINTGNGLAFDSSGNLYVADESAPGNNPAISKITSNGDGTGTASIFSQAGSLSTPVDVAVNPSGTPLLYVTQASGPVLAQISSSGTATTYTVTPSIGGPDYLGFGPNGTLYVTDQGTATIYAVNTSTGASTQFATGIAGTYGLAFAAAPEPSTWALVLVGFVALAFWGKHRRT